MVPELRELYLEGVQEMRQAPLETPDCDGEQHLNNWLGRFRPQRRQAYIRSCISEELRKDRVAPFLKTEVQATPLTKARGIQGNKTDVTGADSGPEFCSFANAMHSVFGMDRWFDFKGKHKTIRVELIYGCGMTGLDFAKWPLRFSKTRYYERDGKNWDATMNEHLLDWAINFYAKIDPFFAKAAQDMRNVKGTYFDKWGFFVTYFAKDTRKSGHNDTSLGNSLINLAIALSVFLNLDDPELSWVSIMVMGDDLIAASDMSDDVKTETLITAEAEFGIKPVGAIFNDITHVTFISARWYNSTDGCYFFGPLLGRLHAKLFNTHSILAERFPHIWRTSVAESFLGYANGNPFTTAWLRRSMNTSSRIEHEKDRHHISEQVNSIDWEFCFNIVYGFTSGEVEELTRWFKLVDCRVPQIMPHPLLLSLFETDSKDPADRPGAC